MKAIQSHWKPSKDIERHHKPSKAIKIHQKTQIGITRHQKTLKDIARYQMTLNDIQWHQMTSTFEIKRCVQCFINVEKTIAAKIWSNQTPCSSKFLNVFSVGPLFRGQSLIMYLASWRQGRQYGGAVLHKGLHGMKLSQEMNWVYRRLNCW